MSDIIGSIGAKAPAITEAPAWEEPCRILIIKDENGRRRGRIEWLTEEVDESFLRDLAVLASRRHAHIRRPVSAS